MSRTFILLLALASVLFVSTGCVTRSTYQSLADEHKTLTREIEAIKIERDSLEQQFYDAQESFEDERVTRETLAEKLQVTRRKAAELDADLGAERIALMETASALAAREAEIASLQSTYDEMVMDLESEVSSGQIEIERLRDGIRLNVSDDVLFASGSAELDRVGRTVLVKVAKQLANLTDFIKVRGHTDDRPIRGSLAQRYPTNWELAAARASRVVRLLEEKGVPGDRLAAVSLGPNDPVVKNDTPANRARNRRIEIKLEPRRGSVAAPAPKPGASTGAASPPAPNQGASPTK